MGERLAYWHKEEKIAVVWIDHPPVNVLSVEVLNQLEEVIQQIAADAEVAAVIITGSGEKAFMAGGDIKSFPLLLGTGEEAGRAFARRLHEVFNQLDFLEKPVIAAINGVALGGGCELALACDIRIAEEQAQIGLPEIKLGILPGAGGTQRLARLVGEAKAKEMMFTGDYLSAEVAKQIGLINRVVPQGMALIAARDLAAKLARHSAPALARIKKSVDQGLELPLQEALVLEARYLGELFQTEQAQEGIQAFIEKRAPRAR